MQVETYEATELGHGELGLDPEEREAAAALVAQLGLEGQQRFIGGGPEDDAPPAIPYRKMTREENAVYSAILPVRTELARYKDGPIPVRVLQVAAHAKEMFDFLYVWHPESADDPDPILVGYVGDHYFSPREIFMLARWGDVLESFSALREKAAYIAKDKLVAQMESIVAEASAHLAALKAMTPTQVLVSGFTNPSFLK